MNPPILPLPSSSSSSSSSDQDQDQDLFDLLPDPLLLVIFNKLSDAKSLARSLSVSKRFSSLIPLTDTVSLSLPPPKPISKPTKSSFPVHLFKFLVLRIITKPFKCLHRLIITRDSETEHNSSNNNRPPRVSIHQFLNPFRELKSLKIEIPVSETEIGLEGSLLKWKAEFGSKLKCCVIFGATSFEKNDSNDDLPWKIKLPESSNTHLLTEEEMKLRIFWTMSCLIAASARHHLAKQIISEQNRVESLVMSDGKKQGKFQMGKERILELRNSMKQQSLEMAMDDYSPELERTLVPDLSMKIWHAPVLELAETECVMRGATLIVIRPVVGGGVIGKGCDDAQFFGCDEEKAINEAVKEMMKLKNSYSMTMNGF